jgi:hypothetical protein
LIQSTKNLLMGFQVLKCRHTRGLTWESHSSILCNFPLWAHKKCILVPSKGFWGARS